MPKKETVEANVEKQWAIVEIFGHSRYAGTIDEHQIGGCSFVRVDVPEIDGQPAFSKLFGQRRHLFDYAGVRTGSAPGGEAVPIPAAHSLHRRT